MISRLANEPKAIYIKLVTPEEVTMAKKEETKKAPAKAEISYDAIITAFETRFDYQAARIMAEEALLKAGLEQKDKFTPEEVKKVADVVTSLDDRTTSVIEGLNGLIG